MSKLVSCGVVLLDRRRRVFACRATGTRRWDLPKGVGDPGEDPRATAVREAWEESGLVLPAAALHDLGEFAYLPGKRLHLFALRVADDAFDPRDCRCRSYYPHHRTGRPMPETDAHAWQPLAELASWSGKSLAKVLAALPWDALEALPEVAAIEVDTGAGPGPAARPTTV
jgi:8-oxo-dGTP pyrophosphatase MutT (NUDIX family)